MPVGRKDWQKATSIVAQEIENLNINVNTQTLERLIEAPSYGGARAINFSGSLDPGYSATPVNIAGTGIIYGGYIYISGVETPDRFGLGIDVDGAGFPQWMLAEWHNRHIDHYGDYYFYETTYDAVNYIYAYRLLRGITFETNWKMVIASTPTCVGTANYVGSVIYALR